MRVRPIDPENLTDLVGAYDDAADCYVEQMKQKGRTEYGFDQSEIGYAGIRAVARAVCPEHHAVYDTRRFVAVNRVQLDILIEACVDEPATETTPETYHRLKTDVLIKGLRAWLPESESK